MAEDKRAVPTQQEGRSTVTSTTPESRRRVVTKSRAAGSTSGDLNAYRGPAGRQARGEGPGTPYMGDRS